MGWHSFKYRNYSPDLGRFWSIDPLAQEYAYQSPYNFSENRVIDGVELEGAERLSVHTPTWAYGTETIRNEHPTDSQINVATAGVVARHPIASSSGADSVVDFLNNEIGREIGAELGEGATEYEAAGLRINWNVCE